MPASSASSSASIPAQSEPVGTGDHLVRSGECIHSIAFDHGHFWETLWNHPDNSDVKEARPSPSLLVEGDRLTVPPIETKDESGATEVKHRFRRKGVPAKLKLQIMRWQTEDEAASPATTQSQNDPDVTDEGPEPSATEQTPDADIPWKCVIDGAMSSGTTDTLGRLEITVSPGAQRGTLTLEPGTPRERSIELCLGGLDPIDSERGVRQRLRNLSFCGPSEEQNHLRAAIEAFQRTNGLDETGQIDDAHTQKLKEIHGS